MDALANHEFKVKVKSTDANGIMEGIQKIANRITTGIILAALIIGASLLMRFETAFRLLGYPRLAIICFPGAAGRAMTVTAAPGEDLGAASCRAKTSRVKTSAALFHGLQLVLPRLMVGLGCFHTVLHLCATVFFALDLGHFVVGLGLFFGRFVFVACGVCAEAQGKGAQTGSRGGNCFRHHELLGFDPELDPQA